MNIKIIYKFIGRVMALEAALMAIPLILSLVDGSGDSLCFIITIGLLLLCAASSFFMKEGDETFHAKDGFAIVGLSWLVLSFFGALPYTFSGKFGGFINAFFESVSGFTTTGSTVLYDVENISRAMNLWRHMTLWLGGMGVLVFTIALLPRAKGSATHILKAETPGPIHSKLVPKMSDSSKILYVIYTALTVILLIISLICGIGLFDAVCHALSTIATGGFTTLNAGLRYFNKPSVEWVYAFAMMISAANFTLIFYFVKKEFSLIIGDEEFKFFVLVVGLSTLFIVIDLITNNVYGAGDAIKNAFFHVTSTISTTGLTTEDINLWPGFSKTVLTILMFFGGSTGSTAGGLKIVRILLMIKIVKYEISKAIHPREIKSIKISKKPINDSVIHSVLAYFAIYVFIFMLSLFLVSMDEFSFESNFSAVATSINNVGICFGEVSQMGSMSQYSGFSKFVLSLCMLIGRLEIFPIILLFSPAFWKKVNI